MAAGKSSESLKKMEEILREETAGYLGLSKDGMPYVVPLNYGYIKGRILFHCSLTGKKLDYLEANPRVCFTVGRQFSDNVTRHPQGALCHVENDSVICYGMARIIDDVDERQKILTLFNRCLQPDAEEITRDAASGCCAVVINITGMTGKQQRGLKHTYWTYTFKNLKK